MCFRPSDVSANDAPALCPECGMENAPGEPKCIFCGASIITEPAPPQAPAPGTPAAPPPAGGPASE